MLNAVAEDPGSEVDMRRRAATDEWLDEVTEPFPSRLMMQGNRVKEQKGNRSLCLGHADSLTEYVRPSLPSLYGKGSKQGVYDIELAREWFQTAAPYLKLLTATLSLVLPIASSAVKLALDDAAYKAIEEQLDFGKNLADSIIGEGGKIAEFMGAADATDLEQAELTRAQGT